MRQSEGRSAGNAATRARRKEKTVPALRPTCGCTHCTLLALVGFHRDATRKKRDPPPLVVRRVSQSGTRAITTVQALAEMPDQRPRKGAPPQSRNRECMSNYRFVSALSKGHFRLPGCLHQVAPCSRGGCSKPNTGQAHVCCRGPRDSRRHDLSNRRKNEGNSLERTSESRVVTALPVAFVCIAA